VKAEEARDADRRGSPLIIAIFLILLYFMAYRYPFQIGDSGTSPTYDDTPLFLQLAKYILILPLAVVAFLLYRGRELAIARVDFLILALTVYCALIGVVILADGSPNGFGIIQVSFSFVLFLVFSEPTVTRRNFGSLVTCLRVFFMVSVAVYAYQLANYFLYERLPALGYYGSFPRFGGVWDDPNSAGIIFMFMLPYTVCRLGPSAGSLLVGVLSIGAIFLTQSLTTYVVTLVVLTPCIPLFYRSVPMNSRLLFMLVIYGVVGIVVSAGVFFILQKLGLTIDGAIQKMDVILDSKSQSIAMRQDSYSFSSKITVRTLMGLEPVGESGENEWLNFVANAGLPFTITYLVFQLLTIRHLWQWSVVAEEERVRPAVIGFFSAYCWFFLMQTNIPAAEVFPINMLAMVIAGMAWAWKIHETGRTAELRVAKRRRPRRTLFA
jgi:hypothetical protein